MEEICPKRQLQYQVNWEDIRHARLSTRNLVNISFKDGEESEHSLQIVMRTSQEDTYSLGPLPGSMV